MEDPGRDTPASVHKFRPFSAILGTVAGASLCVLGLGLLSVPQLAESWWLWGIALYFCGGLGLVVVLVGFYLLLESAADIFLTVEVRSYGLVWRRFGRKTAVSWEEIKTVWNISDHAHHGGRNHRCFFNYAFELCDGSRFLFGPYLKDARQLGRHIEEETTRRLLPNMLRAFHSGETLDFGRLRVNAHGWTKYGVFLPWADVAAVYVDRDGWFTVEVKDSPVPRWFGTSFGKLSNVGVLLGLLTELGVLSSATPRQGLR